MKHLILSLDGTILQIGDDYTTPRDEDIFKVKGVEQPVHRLDGQQYDYNAFTHLAFGDFPVGIVEVGDKYVNGEFQKAGE